MNNLKFQRRMSDRKALFEFSFQRGFDLFRLRKIGDNNMRFQRNLMFINLPDMHMKKTNKPKLITKLIRHPSNENLIQLHLRKYPQHCGQKFMVLPDKAKIGHFPENKRFSLDDKQQETFACLFRRAENRKMKEVIERYVGNGCL